MQEYKKIEKNHLNTGFSLICEENIWFINELQWCFLSILEIRAS